ADPRLPKRPPEELLARFSSDPAASDALAAIWEGLENISLLGSLLHPEKSLDEALAGRDSPQMSLKEPGTEDFGLYKLELLQGLREHFELEAGEADLGRRLFGQELTKGVGLVELLGSTYDVVVANPPYAGSKNLDDPLKGFV